MAFGLSLLTLRILVAFFAVVIFPSLSQKVKIPSFGIFETFAHVVRPKYTFRFRRFLSGFKLSVSQLVRPFLLDLFRLLVIFLYFFFSSSFKIDGFGGKPHLREQLAGLSETAAANWDMRCLLVYRSMELNAVI